MPKPELTKQLLADTLKSLMLKKPLDKISVQDIVDKCGLNRKTFYYHLKDKQALICWIFDNEYAAIEDVNHNNSIIDELLTHLYQNKDFYIAALTSNVQNSLRDHFFAIISSSIMQTITTLLGSEKMSQCDMKVIANYFSNAVVGIVMQWAREGMKTSPYEYNNLFYPITNNCLEFIVSKYGKQE